MKKIIGYCLALCSLLFVAQAYAGLVPGTISKGSFTNSAFCTTTSRGYSPSTGTYWCGTYNSCASASCGVQIYNSCADASCGSYVNSCATPACGCASYNGSGSCVAYNTCTDAACGTSNNTCQTAACGVVAYKTCQTFDCGCASYVSSPVGSFTLTDYANNTERPIFGSSSVNRKLSDDIPRSCTANAYKTTALVEPSYTTWNCPMGNCSPLSISTRTGGSSAECGSFSSTDNLVTSFDQLGSIVSSTPTDSDGSCTVEWRYGNIDDNGPSVSPANIGAFTTSVDTWCSLTNWQNGDGKNAGCATLAGLGNHSGWSGAVDLLENMNIAIGSDPSGIASVVVELGKCTATYTFPSDATILNSTTSPSGVKTPHTQGFTIPYKTTFTQAGVTYPSLLTAFGVGASKYGINECLDEGKNYLRITARDAARSNANGVSLVWNATVYISGIGSINSVDGAGLPNNTPGTATINIDRGGPMVQLSGDARKFFDSNAAENCYLSGAVKDQHWKNYTINGSIKTGDAFGTNCAPRACPTGQAWTGTGCAAVTPDVTPPGSEWTNSCSSVNPSCAGTTCTLISGTPTSENQPWAKDAANCGFVCTNGYTGANCEIKPPDNVCCSAYETTYCWADNGNIIAGNPVISCAQGWQNNPPAWMVNPTPEGTSTACTATVPCDSVTTYSWVTGSYGTCSAATCGGGTQTRSVVCQDNNGSTVADSNCTEPKPAVSQECNTQQCGGFDCLVYLDWVPTTGVSVGDTYNVPNWETRNPGTTSCEDRNGTCQEHIYMGGSISLQWKTTSYSCSTTTSVTWCPSVGSKVTWDTTEWLGWQTLKCWDYSGTCNNVEGGECTFSDSTNQWTLIIECKDGAWNVLSMSCGGVTPWTSCAAPPACDGVSCSVITWSPTGQNQSWVKGAANCGFTCTNGYTGTNCEIPPVVNVAVCWSPSFPSATCYQQTQPNWCIPGGDIVTLISQQGCQVGMAWNISAGNCGGNIACGGNWTCTSGSSVVNCGGNGDVAPAPAYSWETGSYGTCSATCGGGTQSRTVVCKDGGGMVVADSYCTTTKPETSISCNTQNCTPVVAYSYQLFDWTAVTLPDWSCEIVGWQDSWGCQDYATIRYNVATKQTTVTPSIWPGNTTCRDYVPSVWLEVNDDNTCAVVSQE